MDRNLRIRMLLEAGDRVSRPLRDIAGNSTRTGRALKEARDRLKQLEQAQNDLGQFRALKAGLRTTEAQLQGARARVAELAREMNASSAPTKKLTRDFENARRTAAALGLQHERESQELQRLRDRMMAAGMGANGLVGHERELRNAIARTNTEIEEQGRRLRTADERARRFAAGRERFGAIQNSATSLAAGGFSAIATGQTVGRPVLATVDAAMRYQSTMTDIAQKANLSRMAAARMGRELLNASSAANQLPENLARGVDVLAGLGLDARQAVKMMAPIGRAATAYDAEIADLASASFAVSNNLKVPVDQTARVIDIMATAGKAGAVELKDMAQYFPALTAGYQGLGQNGLAAAADLAAVLQVAKEGAGDAATTATNVANIIQKINSPATIRAFKKNFGVDLPGALKKLYAEGKTPLEAIAELTNKTLKGDMSKIGFLFEDAQVQQGLRPIIAGLQEYRRIRAEAMSSGGTVDRDFAGRMKDAAQATQRFAVGARILAITLGTQVLPWVTRLATAGAGYAQWLNQLATRHPVVAKGIMLGVGALSALLVVLGGGAIAIAGILAPFAALKAAAVALNIGMLPMLGIFGGVVIGAMALGAAAYFIYANWGAIAAWFGQLWQNVKSAFSAGITAIGTALLNFTPQGLLLRGFLALFAWLRGPMAAEFVGAGANLVAGLIRGIVGMLGQLRSTVVSAATSAANWFKTKLGIHSPSRVFMGFGGYMMQGLDRGLAAGQAEPIRRVDSLSRQVMAAVAAGATATAAPVAAAPPRAAAPAAAPSTFNVSITIQQLPGQNAQDLARAVRAEIERFERDRRAGQRASMLDPADGADQ